MPDRGRLLEALRALTRGDFSARLPLERGGLGREIARAFNDAVEILQDTTRKNNEQDWLKTHLARFTRLLQGHRDLLTVSRLILSELAPLVNAQQAAFYVAEDGEGGPRLELLAGYAQRDGTPLARRVAFGEGLVGRAALEKKPILLDGTPAGNIALLPVLFEGQVKAVIELASPGRFSDIHQSFLDQLAGSIGVVLHTIAANMQTEYLLRQSQSLTAELQSQQEALTKTNDRLEQQALNLQQARAALEEKAEQLSLSSRYKSEFLANMSHELRTPLNSLLILARLLSDNPGGNLTPKQVEFARTIHASGAELLSLINDILDLAKIESGTITLAVGEERFTAVGSYVERTFREMAADKGLELDVSLDAALPAALETDRKRLQQIVTNLLSNAFKFTSRGRVALRIAPAASGWSAGHPALDAAEQAVSFAVSDTGIGIPGSKQRLIFEAFQQADGTTSREYGGTGLGLSISRELARLLGGEICVTSQPGVGSTFTLFLPLRWRSQEAALAQAEPPEAVPGEPPARPAAELAGRKVMVVDDDMRNVFALTSALESRGLRVAHAESGQKAVELLRRSDDVEAVLMDMMMPGLDGVDTIRMVRQLERYRALPIVAVTAKAMMGDREKCIEAGATDYVAKPVNIDLLMATLGRLLATPCRDSATAEAPLPRGGIPRSAVARTLDSGPG